MEDKQYQLRPVLASCLVMVFGGQESVLQNPYSLVLPRAFLLPALHLALASLQKQAGRENGSRTGHFRLAI